MIAVRWKFFHFNQQPKGDSKMFATFASDGEDYKLQNKEKLHRFLDRGKPIHKLYNGLIVRVHFELNEPCNIYSWFATNPWISKRQWCQAAMLDDRTFCLVIQHGRHAIVFLDLLGLVASPRRHS